MPNCALSIPNWETEGRPLVSAPTNVRFTMIKNDTLYFELTNTQTVYMYFNLNNSSGPINYNISIYRADTLALVSTVNSTTLNLSTNIDLLSGVYIVCLRSISGSYTGTARADYYGFGRVVTFNPIAAEAGAGVDFELKTEPKRKPCDKDMIWTLIDGKLPPGLDINRATGLIYGRLPYLDCLDDPDDEYNNIPSANLFYSSGIDKYEQVEPWGRRWNFKLRIAIADQPEHFEEKWFCLLIYNNWTRTRERFFREYENGLTTGKIIKNVDQEYQIGLCDAICQPKENNQVIEEVIKEFLLNGIQIEPDTDILHIEIDEPDLNKENPNSVTIYQRDGTNNIVTKKKLTIDNDGINYFGAYNNHQTTIEMDNEIINQRNVYVPEIQVGYISEDIMIELNNYEEYLAFRQYARIAKDVPTSNVYEYRDSPLFKDFMIVKKNVKYEYIKYDPNEGIDGVEDSKNISEKVQHYIYIYYTDIRMPEVAFIEDIQNAQKSELPFFFIGNSAGEGAEFKLTTAEQ